MDQTFTEERKDISRAWTLIIGSPYLYKKPIVLPNGAYKWGTKNKTFEVESNSPSWSQLIYFYHNGFEAVVRYIWPQAQQPVPHVTEGAPLVPALVPQRTWSHVSMDLITDVCLSQHLNANPKTASSPLWTYSAS
ncbi:hypothetical protein CEUSTIGMA_g11386.t1 [Chlamydomonas eustigma]|uniref:Uncharacterized protein n=1 Tax=Chlamydomonas eustigma TaxID=1157962 RepID=A0A250XM42_9CHLO|nr:hypothetical protein CEUSTIGMA_g11386.t1 [Chlamydomonas eustigma]|eukprot:GAX83962.1 hypothetical protein CEUSTIGMA_g11386.t1 [Chlamydomonas eustigma]